MKKQEITIYYQIKNRKCVAWGDNIETHAFDSVRQMQEYYSDEPYKNFIFERLYKNWERGF